MCSKKFLIVNFKCSKCTNIMLCKIKLAYFKPQYMKKIPKKFLKAIFWICQKNMHIATKS